MWHGGRRGEAELLASCYRRCIELASINEITSIAFPGISTGIYGYSIEQAAEIAVTTVRETLANVPILHDVIFCCFSPHDLAMYQRTLAGE